MTAAPGVVARSLVSIPLAHRSVTHRLQLLALIALVVAPAILCLRYQASYAIDVPFWDEWEIVPLLDQVYDRRFSFDQLLRQHNEHRISAALPIMLLLGHVTRFNPVAQMYSSWVLICLTGCILYLACARIMRTTLATLLAFLPISWLIFSPRQSENLLWGFQFSLFLSTFSAALAFHLLGRSTAAPKRILLASMCAVASSLSFASGLLVWPIGMLQLLLIRRSAARDEHLVPLTVLGTWAFAGVVTWGLYFADYQKPGHVPSLATVLQDPRLAVSFALAMVGAPLAVESQAARAMGLWLAPMYTGVLIITLLAPPSALRPASVPIALVGFALSSVASITVGRAGFGVEHAMLPRYTALTILGIVGLYLLALQLHTRRARSGSGVAPLLAAVIVLGVVSTFPWAWRYGERTRTDRRAAAYYLSTIDIQSDRNLAALYPDPIIVREYAPILREHHLSVFRGTRPDPQSLYPSGNSTPPLLHLDFINDRAVQSSEPHMAIDMSRDATITLIGWAVDHRALTAAGGVFLVVDEQLHIPALYGLSRPDVARAFQNPAYERSGFSISFATNALNPGHHSLSFKIVTAAGDEYYRFGQTLVLELQ